MPINLTADVPLRDRPFGPSYSPRDMDVLATLDEWPGEHQTARFRTASGSTYVITRAPWRTELYVSSEALGDYAVGVKWAVVKGGRLEVSCTDGKSVTTSPLVGSTLP